MAPAGTFETRDDQVQVRVSGDFKSVESIREIGILANGRLFRLGDIAKVYRGYADPPSLLMRYNGQPAMGLAVSMRKGGDIIALGRGLEASMARLGQDLPVGIDVHKVADQPTVVGRSVNEFMMTLAEAVIIVLAVSFLSLGMRTGIVVALSIPLVLAVTFLLMYLFKIDLQRISLGALIIALGLLVDDAIIAVEMMWVKMEQGWERTRAASFAFTSTAGPMLSGTLVTVAGFLPIAMAKSATGQYAVAFFQINAIALIISWLAAVIAIPWLGYRLLPDPRAAREPGPVARRWPARVPGSFGLILIRQKSLWGIRGRFPWAARLARSRWKRACRPVRSTSCRGSAKRPAPRSPHTPACGMCPSPARWQSAG
jgi:multidrug efflux pump